MLGLSRKRRADDPYSARTPYLAGTIIGVREWTFEGGLRPVAARSGGFEWRSDGSPTEAECPFGEHQPPQPECGCGLYAHHPWSALGTELLYRPTTGTSVIGFVEAWGRIEVHESGFRAQYAKPVAFLFRCAGTDERWRDPYGNHLAELAAKCDADVIHADDPTAVALWLEKNGSELAEESVKRLVTPETRGLRGRLARIKWPDPESVLAFPFLMLIYLFFGILVFAFIAVQFLWWAFIAYVFVAAITGFDPLGMLSSTPPDSALNVSPADKGWHPPMNR